jgi:hypothetical protein
MKTITVKTKNGNEVKVSLHTNKGFNLVNESNFEKKYSGRTFDGRVFEDYKIGSVLVQKTYASWNKAGSLQLTEKR